MNIQSLEKIKIYKDEYEFLPDPIVNSATASKYSKWAHGLEGGFAEVYKLKHLQSQDFYGLKIYKEKYQSEAVLQHIENIRKLGLNDLPGLSIANTFQVIDPRKQEGLVQSHPHLRYALLMRWMDGGTWGEVMIGCKDGAISNWNQECGLALAKSLCSTLKQLESKQCAHCDLTAGNIFINLNKQKPELNLIDLDNLYGSGFTRHKDFIGGQPGYTHPKRSQGHQWCLEGDRFAGAILIAELATWHDPNIRQISGAESFFSGVDLQSKDCQNRFDRLNETFKQISPPASNLLEKAWTSNSLDACPSFEEWTKAFTLNYQDGLAIGRKTFIPNTSSHPEDLPVNVPNNLNNQEGLSSALPVIILIGLAIVVIWFVFFR